jgi:hypothetical protein
MPVSLHVDEMVLPRRAVMQKHNEIVNSTTNVITLPPPPTGSSMGYYVHRLHEIEQ